LSFSLETPPSQSEGTLIVPILPDRRRVSKPPAPAIAA